MKTQRAVRPPYCGSRPGAPTTKGGAQHGHCRAGTLPARERCLLRVPSHHSARNQISRMQVKRNVSRCFFCELALPANIPAPQCRVVRSNHRMTLTKVSCPRSSATPAPMHPSASGRDHLYTYQSTASNAGSPARFRRRLPGHVSPASFAAAPAHVLSVVDGAESLPSAPSLGLSHVRICPGYMDGWSASRSTLGSAAATGGFLHAEWAVSAQRR